MDKTIIGNKKIEISETQYCRLWIHSVELGYGRWVYNNELRDLVKNKPSVNTNIPTKENEVKNESTQML